MTDKPKDGGPAFPNRGDNTPGNETYDGMSLRQWYAGLAMQGLLAQGKAWSYPGGRDLVTAAVDYADLLVAKLEEGK